MSQHHTPAWRRLDNAAKIFPPASSIRDTKVFRFCCVLTENVVPDLLQQALEEALEEFPFYQTVLKQGLFWYYLEESKIKSIVREESRTPCAPIYQLNRHGLLFQVTYYGPRINLEIYHALTDGTGALQFLRTIVLRYLSICHQDILPDLALDYDASTAEKWEDSFQKYYRKKSSQKEKSVKAYQVRSSLLPEGRLRVISGICPVEDILRISHEHNCTMTVYLTALFLLAMGKEMSWREKSRPVTISIPVNLRNYFDSETARNFFSVINVSYRFGQEEPELDQVIQAVRSQFEQKLTKPKLSEHLNKLIALEKNPGIRIVPLPLKRFVLRIAHNMEQKSSSASLSNIGKISMPEPLFPYLDHFEVFVSTTRIQACVCSFDSKLSVSFTAPFVSTQIEKNFFRQLTKQGVSVEIISNQTNEQLEEQSNRFENSKKRVKDNLSKPRKKAKQQPSGKEE